MGGLFRQWINVHSDCHIRGTVGIGVEIGIGIGVDVDVVCP